MELEAEMANVSDLESKTQHCKKKFETLSKTHKLTKAGLAKNCGETSDELGKKTKEFDALRAKIDEPKKESATLRVASIANDKKIHELELQVASDDTNIAYLATLVKDNRLNFPSMTTESGEFQNALCSIVCETSSYNVQCLD